MKNFLDWFSLKPKLDAKDSKPPLVSEADLWWASIGENVGSEMGGKSTLYSRPVIIIKKLSHNFYFVVPTTTKVKEGSWYVSFVHRGIHSAACLHQARAIDYRRLSSKMGTLDETDYANIKEGFKKLYL